MEKKYKYNSFIEFKKDNPYAYNVLRHKKLINKLCDDMGWTYLTSKPAGYWTKERCIEEARKYNTKGEWAKAINGGATSYNVAIKNGWFDECIAHMITLSKPAGYWQIKENCLKEARKYNNRGVWQKNSSSSYNSARKNGWYGECTAHMVNIKPNGYWQIKENVINEAKKYQTRSEWGKKSSSSYNMAKENGWFDECTAHMNYAHTPAGYWSKERVLTEIKKYDSYSKWIRETPNAYFAAKRNGYLDECLVYLPNNTKRWTKETCLEEALKYKSVSEWQKNNNGSQKSARKNGWFDECTAHMIKLSKPAGYWQIKENCIEEAKKHTSPKKWSNKSGSSYNSARKNGWYEECIANMVDLPKIKGYWTKERCLEEAKKYKNRTEWCKNGGGSYGAAKENGWFEECAAHMKYLVRPNGTWTKELLLVEARKWKTRTEWAKHGEGYSRALKLNCFEECTAHMDEISKPSGYWQIKENCLEEARKYKTKSEWQEKSNGSQKSARKNGWYDECTAHMKTKKLT